MIPFENLIVFQVSPAGNKTIATCDSLSVDAHRAGIRAYFPFVYCIEPRARARISREIQ
jgi:hypothetical protein